jgi:predicted DCC family thiol-disulfide oxidoreductase YuxK
VHRRGNHPYNGSSVTTANSSNPSGPPTSAVGNSSDDTRDGHAIVLFDGECNLCSGSVRFVLARDRGDRFRFASLQSDAGRALLEKHHLTGAGAGENGSIVLIDGHRVSTRSTAALRIAGRLKFPWPILSVFLLIPRPLRDVVYTFIARHRYRWFGKADACAVDPSDASGAASLRSKILS